MSSEHVPIAREEGREFRSLEDIHVDGLYDVVDGRFLAIYAYSRTLFLQIEKESWPLTPNLKASCTTFDDGKHFSVEIGENVVCFFNYKIEVDDTDLRQPFFHVDKDDFDICESICSLVNSGFRQRTMLRIWSNGVVD